MMFITLETLKDRFLKLRSCSDSKHFDHERSLEDSNSALVLELLSTFGRIHKKDSIHLSVILANLLWCFSIGGYFSAIPMSESKIVASINGFGLAQNRIKALVLLLQQHGFIEFHGGFQVAGAKRRTKIRVTKKLLALARRHCPNGIDLVRPAKRNAVRMKAKAPDGNSKGKLCDYGETRTVRTMRSRLDRYNQLLDANRITLDPTKADRAILKKTDFSETFTYRVFNDGRWNRGGRFYGGWWQNISNKDHNEQRTHILINDEPTVEIDFCTQSLVLLYAIEGIHFGNMSRDGYEVLDPKGKLYPRHVVKEMFTISLNRASVNSTISAFFKERERKEEAAIKRGEPFSSFPRLDRGDCRRILGTFQDTHSQIAHHLSQDKDKGKYLQYLDSAIADEILRLMTRAKIPVLCVHDSFIVAVQHEQDLLQAIAQAYSRVLKEKLQFTAKGMLCLKRTEGACSKRFRIPVPPLSILPFEAHNKDTAEFGFDGNTMAQLHRTQLSADGSADTHKERTSA